MNLKLTVLAVLTGLQLAAQTTVFLPSDHATVEGADLERRLPFSNGPTMRTQLVYEGLDLSIPGGRQITHLGFRQDAAIPSLGTTLDLQIFIGPTTMTAATATNNFANNYAATPTEVFTRKTFVLPDLGNPLNPNPNGNLVVIPLDVPFPYVAGQNLAVEYRVHGNGLGAGFNYQIDKATFLATNGSYGQGCTGSNTQVPRLVGASTNGAVPGAWTLNASRCLGNAIAVLGVSFFEQNPPGTILAALGAPGCDVFIGLGGIATFTHVTSSSGNFSRTIAIPDAPELDDIDLYAQVIVLDAAANGAGLVVSDAFHTELGMTPRMTSIATTSLTAATGSVVRNNGIVSLFRYQ
jgi:hypothetical protein